MIQDYASIAVRSHDRLVLPDASGIPVLLISKLPELMAALSAVRRGAWWCGPGSAKQRHSASKTRVNALKAPHRARDT
jgi:hypothetical protein